VNAHQLSVITQPVKKAKGRLTGLDVARAMAIVGMVWVNFRMHIYGVGTAPKWAEMLDGRAAALFVMLAGVGVSLMSRNKTAAEVRPVIWRRAAVLYVVGMAWSPVWFADIIHYYGVWLAMAALLVKASSRVLAGLAAATVFTSTVLMVTMDWTAGWDFTTLHYTEFWTLTGQLRHLLFNGLHPVFPWFAFMLVGMIVGRWDLSSARVQKRMVAGGLTVWAAFEVISDLLIEATTPVLGEEIAPFLFGSGSMPPTALYALAAGALAIAAIGAAQWFVQKAGDILLVRALTHLGQLSLSVYIVHGVVSLLGYHFLLGVPLIPFVVPATVVFSLLALVAAHHWRLRHKRGPFELLLRKVAG